VAEAVAVDSWSGQGVRLSEIVGALADLRDQSSRHAASARTAVMTIVAVAPGDEQAYAATGALRSLAGHHPARIVLLRPYPDEVASLEGRAALYTLETDNHNVNFEEVAIEVGGQAANHLDSLVEAFTLSDLPVAVWYVSSLPNPSDPLLAVADVVVVDSRDASDPISLRGLLQLARRRTVVDLSWSRLKTWRDLGASLFGPRENRSWLDAIEVVDVCGKVGPRGLIGGWLVDRIGLDEQIVTFEDARHVSFKLTARRDGEEATFAVERHYDLREVVATVRLPGQAPQIATAELPEDALASSLAEALTRLGPDPVWEAALSEATSLAGA
jgi:glucose-6-phosphate dehydrogenase assembly protein OpcA